ncbi:MAG: hypothetical protein WC789_04750 [Lentisphaeria bacterium]|jgi:hypothetical protein
MKKTTKWTFLVVGVLAVLGLVLIIPMPHFRYPFTERESVTRIKRISELKQIKMAFKIYQEENEKSPDSLASLVQAGILEPEFIQDYMEVTTPQRAIFLKMSFRAVKIGEPWGGLGDSAENNIPEGRLIWTIGEEPKIIEEREFQKLYK